MLQGVTSIREDASAAATFGDSDAAVMADEMLTEEERVAQFWAIEEVCLCVSNYLCIIYTIEFLAIIGNDVLKLSEC